MLNQLQVVIEVDKLERFVNGQVADTDAAKEATPSGQLVLL